MRENKIVGFNNEIKYQELFQNDVKSELLPSKFWGNQQLGKFLFAQELERVFVFLEW